MPEFFKSISLLLVLLNPFLVIIYLLDMVQKFDGWLFTRILIRAGIISLVVFCLFAIVGDTLFSEVMQVEFASFQIFGGIVFLIIGLQFVFRGPTAIEILRGESEHLAGAIAMPILIGPGTISASVVIGKKLGPLLACAAVAITLVLSVAIMVFLKRLHDFVRPRNEGLIQRYIEVAGRITALFVGTISIEMIMRGIRAWIQKF